MKSYEKAEASAKQKELWKGGRWAVSYDDNLFGTLAQGLEELHAISTLAKTRVCTRHKHGTPRLPSRF